MHSNGFVLSVADSSGQILRELDRTVYLPFDSEYTLSFKNLKGSRAVLNIRIDGLDALGGKQLIIPAYSTHSLERFLTDGNMQRGRKFKFVRASDTRVDPSNPSNGSIHVDVQWEATYNFVPYNPPIVLPFVPYVPPMVPYTLWPSTYYCAFNGPITGSLGNSSVSCSSNVSVSSLMFRTAETVDSFSADASQKGATVAGGISTQSFDSTFVGALEPGITVLQLSILAPVNQDEPLRVVDTKKKYCEQCRKKLPYDAKFCSRCGHPQS